MHEFQGPVRFGTEKVVGFPRLTAIFETVISPDSFVKGGVKSGTLRRIFGLATC